MYGLLFAMSDYSPASSFVLPRMPSFSLRGKRALVTGGTRGLGLAAVVAIAQAGGEVCCVARGGEELGVVVRACVAEGWQVSGEELDILDRGGVDRFLSLQDSFDVLVNNAGTNTPQAFLDVEEGVYDGIMDLNLRAVFFLSQGVARGMRERGGGAIVHVSSQMGLVGGERRTAYCASKHGIEGLTKAMALDLARYGIRVNSIAPTFVETALTRPFLSDEAERASILSRIPLGRLGRVEDVMGAVVFLCSEASSLVTGASIAIDGGWTAR